MTVVDAAGPAGPSPIPNPSGEKVMAKGKPRAIPPSLTDVKTCCACARKQIEDGALTPDYELDPDQAIHLLNNALATELNIACCATASTPSPPLHPLRAHRRRVFWVHPNEERPTPILAQRIVQLGGTR